MHTEYFRCRIHFFLQKKDRNKIAVSELKKIF